jgi:hypothetical protein
VAESGGCWHWGCQWIAKRNHQPMSREDSLVVGICHPRWKAKGTHQRVFTTRWWWWMPVPVEVGWPKETTNESSRLIGGDLEWWLTLACVGPVFASPVVFRM